MCIFLHLIDFLLCFHLGKKRHKRLIKSKKINEEYISNIFRFIQRFHFLFVSIFLCMSLVYGVYDLSVCVINLLLRFLGFVNASLTFV